MTELWLSTLFYLQRNKHYWFSMSPVSSVKTTAVLLPRRGVWRTGLSVQCRGGMAAAWTGSTGEIRGRLGYNIRLLCNLAPSVCSGYLREDFVQNLSKRSFLKKTTSGHSPGCFQDLFFAENPQNNQWVTQQPVDQSWLNTCTFFFLKDIIPMPVCILGTVCTFATCHSSNL